MMNNNKENPITLDVPYFKQTRISTCGPAALMMVMKYWDPSFELSKKMENSLWIKSNPFVFFGGTLQFGLAKSAVHKGFKAEIFQKARMSQYHPTKHNLFEFLENLIALSAHRVHVIIHYGTDMIVMIQEALNRKIPPLVFVNLFPLIGENVFHWLVVTGIEKNTIYVNDPYISKQSSVQIKKDYPLRFNHFRKAMDTHKIGNLRLPPCIILVHK